jgi:hypothetical protein
MIIIGSFFKKIIKEQLAKVNQVKKHIKSSPNKHPRQFKNKNIFTCKLQEAPVMHTRMNFNPPSHKTIQQLNLESSIKKRTNGAIFSTKENLTTNQKSGVAYQVSCLNCNLLAHTSRKSDIKRSDVCMNTTKMLQKRKRYLPLEIQFRSG